MKKMKKLFAMLLTLAMVFGMSMTSFAASTGNDGVYGTADDTGKITVSGIEKNADENISVKAYPIIRAQYDTTTGTFIGYKSLYDVTDISKNTLITSNLDLSASQLTEYTAEVKKANATGTDMTLEGTDYVLDGVAVGTYLVLVENTESHSYNPMVVSVFYTNEDGSTTITEGKLDLNDGTATAKKSDEPGLDKEITNANTSDTNKGNSVEVGDTVDYKVTVTPIPSYTGSYPKLNVVDRLDAGLAFVTTTDPDTGVKTPVAPVVKVNNVALDSSKYTVDFNGQQMTINFVVNGAYTLNDYAGGTLTIDYSAEVTKAAVVWDGVNKNTATLNYTRDSKVDGNDHSTDKKTYTYTFDIDGKTSGTKDVLVKTEKVGEEEKPLSGALFGLYKSGENVTAETVSTASANAAYKTATSDLTGQLEFSQLKEGTYFLKELSAPDNYSVNTHVYTIDIAAKYNPDGTLKSWTITIDGEKTSTFTSKTTEAGSSTAAVETTGIVNTKLSSLPSTGGIGTTIFTIAGCAIMIAAAGLFFASRKKSDNK